MTKKAKNLRELLKEEHRRYGNRNKDMQEVIMFAVAAGYAPNLPVGEVWEMIREVLAD